jgi:carbonic anhydrase/acetyltransferase-like protein (isoleucine patch superfamily)
MPHIRPFDGKQPTIGEHTFVADNATIIGDVVVGQRTSIWYGVVLRGDVLDMMIVV